MEAPLVNRIAKSKLITIDPGKYYPTDVYLFDLKDFLFQGLILREKDFRDALDSFNWNQIQDKLVHVYCSTDAIIPLWAYMLIASKAEGYASSVSCGNKADFISTHIVEEVRKDYPETTIEKGKFVIKGCSDVDLSPDVYSALTSYLVEHGARSIMFGEPCSTVPIYKKRKI